MSNLKLSSLLLSFFLPTILSTNCPLSTCGAHAIRFPFRLPENPPSCSSYQGITLSCKSPHNKEHHAVLNLPGSGDLLVRNIDYPTHTLLLSDPENCLPKRLLGLNLSASPFAPRLSTNTYTLFSCPRRVLSTRFPAISCLSNATSSVVGVLDGTSVGEIVSKRCRKMDTFMAPDGFLLGDAHLTLKWSSPQREDCFEECEGNGGTRYSRSGKGGGKQTQTGLEVLKIIAMSIAIPAMICAIGVGFFLCVLGNSASGTRIQQVGVSPRPAPVMEGLDQATIDTYAKVVVGESKRVPGPNDDTCPICLSEFSREESLRCIPQCQHCFHADCVDEWLRIKGSCPLCRKSPSDLHPNV